MTQVHEESNYRDKKKFEMRKQIQRQYWRIELGHTRMHEILYFGAFFKVGGNPCLVPSIEKLDGIHGGYSGYSPDTHTLHIIGDGRVFCQPQTQTF